MDNFLLNQFVKPENISSPILSIFVAAILFWSISVKGVALFHAANRNEKIWFIGILVINSIGVLEVAYLFFFSKDKLILKEEIANLRKLIARKK